MLPTLWLWLLLLLKEGRLLLLEQRLQVSTGVGETIGCC
jgi:hypothetical protein